MNLSGVKVRPERSHQKLALWFTNKKNLKERITHPEHRLWRNKSKVPQLLLSVPREHKRVLTQKQYLLVFTRGIWSQHCAIVILKEVVCYES